MAQARLRERQISRVIETAAETLSLDEIGRDVLPHLSQLLGTSKLLFYCSRNDQPLAPVAGDAECLPEYSSEFAHQDPLQEFMRIRNPLFFAGSHSPAWPRVTENGGLRDFYRRWELSWLFHLRLSETAHMDPGYVAIICGRSFKQNDFEKDDLRAVAAVLPSLQAAVRRTGRMAARLSSAAAVEALFDRGQPRAVLALDLHGRLLWASARGERLLEACFGPRGQLPEGLLSAVKRLKRVAQGETVSDLGTGTFSVALPADGKEPVDAEVYLARTASGEPFVAVDCGGEGLPFSLLDLARRCGLTRSETEVLSDLARGQADAEIAGHRFVSIPTIRTHVTRILHKCGVRSRLEAVALALGTAPKGALRRIPLILGAFLGNLAGVL